MTLLSPCTRPAMRWFGGKWRLAPWIIAHLPRHREYVEPFGGGASVLLRKPRSHAEVYNDLDVDAVNLFRVLRDDALAAQLVQQLRLTPFAREEFVAAYGETDDPVERARRLIVLSFQGFGSNAHAKRSTGFRSNSSRSGTTPAHDWAHYPDALRITVERLAGVVIENRPAISVMAQHDSNDAVHYVDPPYVWATRARSDMQRSYRHEMDDGQHVELLEFLRTLRGAVVLSGYPHALYDEALADWHRVERIAHADGARERTEVLWLNPACVDRLDRRGLFEVVA
ncbi:MAG: DNA adenine methylase [Reyranella sp.]|nr:DNA adenine methylase [Reyranella sp.]